MSISLGLVIAILSRPDLLPTTPYSGADSPAVVASAAGLTPACAAAAGLTGAECAAVVAMVQTQAIARTEMATQLQAARAARRSEGRAAGQQHDAAARAQFTAMKNALLECVAPERRARLEQVNMAASFGLDGALMAVPTTPEQARALAIALRMQQRAIRLGEPVPEGAAATIAAAEASAAAVAAGQRVETVAALNALY